MVSFAFLVVLATIAVAFMTSFIAFTHSILFGMSPEVAFVAFKCMGATILLLFGTCAVQDWHSNNRLVKLSKQTQINIPAGD